MQVWVIINIARLRRNVLRSTEEEAIRNVHTEQVEPSHPREEEVIS